MNIEETLDELLNYNLEVMKNGGANFKDIIIIGPAGIGKTTVVRKWLLKHEDEIKPYWLIVTPDVVRSLRMPDGSDMPCAEFYLASNQIDSINKPGTVLFIDMFDLTEPGARKHLLELVAKRQAVYTLDGEKTTLNNVIMIIATAWPDKHLGREPLSDDELKAFEQVLRVTSV